MAEAGGSAGALGGIRMLCAGTLPLVASRAAVAPMQRSSSESMSRAPVAVRALCVKGMGHYVMTQGAARCRSLLQHEPALWNLSLPRGG